MKISIFGLVGMLGTIVFAASQAVAAEPVPEISYRYYDVSLDDDRPLIFKALEAAPIRVDGQKRLSLTTCKNDYTYTSGPGDKDCQVKDYELTTSCEIVLPRFVGSRDKFLRQLDGYLDKVKEYELAHVRINAEHMKKFAARLDGQPDYPCDGLDEALKKDFAAVSGDIKAARKKMDEETSYGRTVGADMEWHLAADEERPLLAESAAAESKPVTPALEYVYKDVPVDQKTEADGSWRNEAGRVNWDLRLYYKPRQKADGACRVLYYTLDMPCRIELPKYIGAGPSREKEMAAFVEEVKELYSDCCRAGAQKADQLTAKITGANTFDCATMEEDIAALVGQTEKDVQQYIDAAIAAYRDGRVSGGNSGTVPEVKHRYYDVKVTAPDQALKEAWDHTRLLVGDQKSLTATALEAGFKYQTEKLPNNQCRITRPDITLVCTLHLPRFKSGDPQAQEALGALAEKIEAAEMKRCEIAAGQMGLLRQELLEKTFPCPAIGNYAQGHLNTALKEAQKKMNEYLPDYEK